MSTDTRARLVDIDIIDKKTAIMQHPSNEHLHIIAEISVLVVDTTPTNANPSIGPTGTVNLCDILGESVSMSDIQRMNELATHLDITQSEWLRRWGKVLLYFLGYIDNPAPSE